ncbi:MAG: hypothetical protein IJ756_05860 [Paludibacteraceae bacterium]|nr:hypothetical protein [Paludibacteraceae bacterium]
MKNISEDRRNFGNVFKLHLCCATDRSDVRQYIHYIHFRNGYAYATDAHIIVRADIATVCYNLFTEEEIQHLDGKSIHADSYKQLLSESFVTIDEQGFHAKDEAGNEIIYCVRDLSAPRPNTNESAIKVPNFAKIFDELGDREEMDAIGISSKFLERLVNAMGGDAQVRIDLNGTKAMKVTHISSAGTDDIEGVLMPIWLNRENEVVKCNDVCDSQTNIDFPTAKESERGNIYDNPELLKGGEK